MVGLVLRGAFSVIASSTLLKKAASRYGLRRPNSVARRFVAGQDSADAIAAARLLESQHLSVTLDLLGEAVASMDDALAAARAYATLIHEAAAAGVSRNISVKLTQIGLVVDRATAIDNLRRILDPAVEHGFFVRIDMEGSGYTDDTFEAIDALWGIGYRNIGVAVQAALRRSMADVERLNAMGVSVRLVKGAYREPRAIAFVKQADVSAHFTSLMQVLLASGHAPAIATHDTALIAETRAFAASKGIGMDRFEFELLYGMRRDLQRSLVRDGCRVRVYLPFGREWFPYFMRRLGERPANIAFVLRHVLGERRVP